MTRRVLELCLLAPGAITAGCGTEPGGPPPPPVQTDAVDVRDNRFDPVGAAITMGDEVTWTWLGANQHNVTFEDGQGSSATQVMGTHQRTFQQAGTFRYRCTIHSTNFDSGMTGAVVVE